MSPGRTAGWFALALFGGRHYEKKAPFTLALSRLAYSREARMAFELNMHLLPAQMVSMGRALA
jgi:hypothetical protein